MISVKSLSKKFLAGNSPTVALDNITFNIKAGEVIGFLGPNGAGKTTTMRILTGILNPTAGSASVNGLNPSAERLEIAKIIGYLPENNPLYGEMTVGAYLKFIARLKGVRDVEKIVSDVSLGEVTGKRIESLSRGYRQRVGLAAAMIGEPEVLILDEPTSGLDPIEQDRIKKLIKSVARNKIVIFSTHILSEVEAVANRLIIINRGRIAYDGKKPKGSGAVEKLFRKLVK